MDQKPLQLQGRNVETSSAADQSEDEDGPFPNLETDGDSDGDSITSTRSVLAHNVENVWENGRRYCNSTYFMPNDEAEQTRLNIIHQLYLILLDGRLTTAPIPPDAPRVLDIGTGPGDWAVEMSQQYPNAQITAADISVFDTSLNDLDLPNVSFQLDDARQDWTYREPFDLVHVRGMSGAFRDWRAVYQQAYRHLKPGGYLEVADADPAGGTLNFIESASPNPTSASAPTKSCLHVYSAAMQSAARAAGYPRDLNHLRSSAFISAGFVDLQVFERHIPVGLWPDDPRDKTLGKIALVALLEGLEAYSLRQLTRTGKWSPDAVRNLCEQVKREVLTATKMTCRVRVVAARKPVMEASRIESRRLARETLLQRSLKRVNLDEYSTRDDETVDL